MLNYFTIILSTMKDGEKSV